MVDKDNGFTLPGSDVLSSIEVPPPKVEMIIPTINEEKTINLVIDKALKFVGSILVIDGGSTDNTVETAKEMGAKIVHQNSRGKGLALREAFEHVDGEIVVLLDGDGSMSPEEIPLFVKQIDAGADVVKGSRFMVEGGSEDISRIRKFGNAFFLFLVNMIYGTNFSDLCYGFIVLRKDAVKKLACTLRSKGFNIETEILIKSKKLGLKIVEVPSFESQRLFGRSRLKALRDGFSILCTIVREVLVN